MKKMPAVLLVLIGAVQFATAQLTFDQITHSTPSQWLQTAWNLPFFNDKLAALGQLATTHPSTIEGQVARAYLLHNDGKENEAIQLADKVLAAKPGQPNALFTKALCFNALDKYEDCARTYQALLQADPSLQQYTPIRNLYFLYLESLNAPDKANALLTTWEQKLGNQHIFDFIRGINAEVNENAYQKAESYYVQAIEKEKIYEFDLYERLIDLRIKKLHDGSRLSVNDQIAYFAPLIEKIKAASNGQIELPYDFQYSAYMKIGDLLLKYNADKQAQEYYRLAMQQYNSSEIPYSLYLTQIHQSNNPQEALALFGAAMKTQLTNCEAQKSWGDVYYFEGQFDKSAACYEKAIELAPNLNRRYNIVFAYADNVLTSQQKFEKADQLYRQLLTDGYTDKADIYDKLSLNSFNNSKFEQAAKEMKQAEKIRQEANNINQNYYNARNAAFTELLTHYKQMTAFYKENPFNEYWQKSFGQGVKVHINFSTNSDVIPSGDYDKLAKLAKLLTENGASDYRFRIEGHTDNTGTDAINEPLSVKRAESVARHLQQKYNIAPVRMEVSGYGSRQPAASNATDAGRSENRRVDILLSANIHKPRIAATTTLKTDWLDFSSDGRYFVTGYNPMQVWDAEKAIKIKDYEGYYRDRWFSPNGRYIAAIAAYSSEELNYYVLTIIDNHTGSIIDLEPLPNTEKSNYDVSWSPYNDKLALVSSGYDAAMLIYDVASKKVDQRIKLNKRFYHLTTWVNDQYIVDAQRGEGGVLTVFDAHSLKPVKTLTEPNWTHAIGRNSDGSKLIATDNSAQIHVWETGSWSHRQAPIGVAASRIKAHPDDPSLVLVNDWSSRDGKKVFLYALDAMTVKNSHTFDETRRSPFFVNDHTIATVSTDDDFVQFFDMNFTPTRRITGEAEVGQDIFADTDNNYLISTDQAGIHVWDVITGSKAHCWEDHPASMGPVPGKQNQFLAIRYDEDNRQTIAFYYDTKDFTRKEILRIPFKVTRWGIYGQDLLVAGTPFLGPDKGSEKGEVVLYDLATLKKKTGIQVYLPMADLRFSSLGGSGFESIDLSPDHKKVLVSTYWIDGWKTSSLYAETVREFDLYSGQQVRSKNLGAAIHTVEYIDANSYRLNDRSYKYSTGEYLRILSTPPQSPVASHQSYNLVARFPKQNLKATYDRMVNTIRFEPLETKGAEAPEALDIVVKKKNEWIAYTASGEFTASLNGTNKVYWLLGKSMLEFDALKSKYERPDLVRNKLRAIADGQVVKKTEPVVEPDLFEMPYKATLTSAGKATQKEKAYTMELAITKSSDKDADPVMVYKHNGRRIAAGRGFEVVPKKKTPVQLTLSKNFDLQEGYNLIEAMIVYKDAEIPVAKSEIVYQAPQQEQTVTATNRQLWFFGVGVSVYQKPEQNLEFADRDILSMAEKLQQQEGKLYKKVNIKTLTNDEATERNVRIQLNDFLKMASAEDLIIIYVAGHGVQDNEQNLYFMTHDADLSKPYTGMQITQFQSFLRSRPINQKALFLMDICHAGTVSSANRRGQVTAEDAIKQLAEGTGTIVFASSTGKQSSLESEQWGGGHGAFSWALLQGLDGGADKDAGNNDGMTTVLELQSYVSRKVPELTDGNQHPTTPESFNVKDYPIYRR